MESGSKTNVRILLYVGRNIIDEILCSLVDVGMIPFIISDKRKKNLRAVCFIKLVRQRKCVLFNRICCNMFWRSFRDRGCNEGVFNRRQSCFDVIQRTVGGYFQ